jgi:hypothetical protein
MALLNLVFLFIFIGVLVASGLQMYGSIVKRGKINDTKGGLENQVRMIVAWAEKNGHLPAVGAEYLSVFGGTAPVDAWGRPIYYVYDGTLTVTASGGLCGRTSTVLLDSTANLAFALVSGGDDFIFQTTLGGAVVAASGPGIGTLSNYQSDLYRAVPLEEMKSKAGCYGPTGGRLMILNNELPRACASAAYSATVFASGGVPSYKWCTVATLPGAITATGGAEAIPVCPTFSTGTYPSILLAGTAPAAAAAPLITFRVQDSQVPTPNIVERTYPINVISGGACGGGGGTGTGTGVNTGSGGSTDTSGNNTSSALFEQNIVTPNSSIQVANNQIQFGFNAGNGSACIWYPYNFPLYGKTMRAFWNFVFSNNDTSLDSTTYADGYTFTLMQGSNPVTYCGTGTTYNASTNPSIDCSAWGGFGEFLAYCGLPNNSIALEFDIYPSGGRNDPTNNYNHVAVVKSTATHVGNPAGIYGDNTHNHGGNPACGTGTTSATAYPPLPACNGSCNNRCTGTCNGLAISNAACVGTCIGSCTGSGASCSWAGLASNGICSGTNTCFGTCDETATANTGTTCAGTCYGACTGTNYDSKGANGGATCLYNSFGGNNFPILAGHPNGATWLEDLTTHDVRVEVHTRCNVDCSSCNSTTTTCSPTPAAPGKVFVKAWIDTGKNDITSDEPSTPDVSYCVDLPTAMNLVKMGFTQGTGASAQMGTITNLNANFFGTCPTPNISSSPAIPNGYRVGSSFPTTTFSASGGTTPYSNWVFQGTKPTGTVVANAATFATTPKITGGTLNTTGRYDFAVAVSDACTADGGTSCNTLAQTQMYTVYVCSVLSITTPSLANGYNGSSYSQTMTATGGTAPFTWSATGLPAGLTISASGVISGIPTIMGTYNNIIITVSDACGSTVAVSRTYNNMSILSPLPTCTLVPGTSAVPYNGSTNLTWTIVNGPASSGTWSGAPGGTCTNSKLTTTSGGTCTIANQTNPGPHTFTANLAGSNSCSTTVNVQYNTFTLTNNTGGTIYPNVNGCKNGTNDKIGDGQTYTINYTDPSVTFWQNRGNGNSCNGNSISIAGSDATAADTNYGGQVQITNSWQLVGN